MGVFKEKDLEKRERMEKVKNIINKIVIVLTIILSILWLILTIMICKDLTDLQKENKQLQIEIEQKNGDINYLDKVIETREEEFKRVEAYKARIKDLQEENRRLNNQINVLERKVQ